MPCLSLKHVLLESARAKQVRLARRNVAKSLKTTRLRLKSAVIIAKFRAKVTHSSAKSATPVNIEPVLAEKTQESSKKLVKIASQRPHSPKFTEETLKITHPRLSRVPQDGRKNVTAIYTTSAKKSSPAPSKRPETLKLATRADMINAESRLGSMLFGPIPSGHRREFFHDRSNVWIWHEDWTDATQKPHQLTIRYEVRPDGVYKKVSAGRYFKLAGDELENFRRATHAYLRLIKTYIYRSSSQFSNNLA